MGVARQPDFLEVGLATLDDFEAVHRNEHRYLPVSIE
jgi:hypothetical protein